MSPLTLLLSGQVTEAILFILVMLYSTVLHEWGHALMATYWGDPTPRQTGALHNPFTTVYWPGFLMFVAVGFGILGQVPVNPRAMRDARWGSFWTSFAGPLMNLGVALIAALIFRLLPMSLYMSDFGRVIGLFLLYSISFNILLFIFNLLPFFPLDGWRMALGFLPGYWLRREQIPPSLYRNAYPIAQFLMQPAYKWAQWAQLSQMVLLVLVFVSFAAASFPFLPNPLMWIIGSLSQGIASFLIG